jgi:hypothetical protein
MHWHKKNNTAGHLPFRMSWNATITTHPIPPHFAGQLAIGLPSVAFDKALKRRLQHG